jgi:hypothetical protein
VSEGNETKKPPIDLSPARVMCGQHGALFRHRWPMGYAAFVLYQFEALVADTKFTALTGGDQLKIGPLLSQVPSCCRLRGERLYAIYQRIQAEQRVWILGRCRHCGRRNVWGGPVKSKGLTHGSTRTVAHLCLRCVAFSGRA